MKAVQLRMARAAVGWGVRDLAKQAGVTANTVTRIENGADAKRSTMDALRWPARRPASSSLMVNSPVSASQTVLERIPRNQAACQI